MSLINNPVNPQAIIGHLNPATDNLQDLSVGNWWRNANFSGTVKMGLLSFGTSGDALLQKDAANTLALRNGENNQILNVYGAYTDASNYERIILSAGAGGGGVADVGTQQAGTGSPRPLGFLVAGTRRWVMSVDGHLLAGADNTYDIGASGATRPRNIYVAGEANISGRVRGQHFMLEDGMTAPAALAGFAKIYVDTADGDLKVIFGDGTVKTLATDT